MGTDLDVLQVITSTAPRGAERFATALEPELVARGLTVQTVALTKGEPHGLDVEPLGPTRLGPTTLRALRSRARTASVVAAHGSTTLPACALATLGTGVPFTYRNIGDPHYWSTSWRRRTQSRLLLSRAKAVVALTDRTATRIEDLYTVAPDRIRVIPRGVSAEHFPPRAPEQQSAARAALGVSDGERVAICVGALSEEKDVAGAVRAIAMLPERWRLFVAGDGPDRAAVEREAATVGADRVRLLGALDDVTELMRAADLLLLPSRTEGLPGVVIEAAMIGVPAVATKVGFVDEIIDDGINGRLVPPTDPAAMAEAVRAVDDDAELERLGRAAQASADERYSLAATADRWYDLLTEITQSRPRTLTP